MTIFDWLKEHVSIVDVISMYTRLARLGNYYKASCLFHSERDASFTVSPDKNIFYCFGCHATGDAIAFIARIEHLGQFESAKFIIDRYGLTLPPELLVRQREGSVEQKNFFLAACQFFKTWTVQQLKASPTATSYINSRSMSQSTLDLFEVGYQPGGPEQIGQMLKNALKAGVSAQHLVDAGIIIQANFQVYHSPYEERIIFPIHDSVGRCVGFGGRVFRENDARAKYYNSRESDYFLKRTLLFGFNLARKSLQERDTAYLVEGYLDCMAFAGAGLPNTIATLGTACTQDHLKQLARFVRKLYVVYDADSAGQKATMRMAELCWAVNLDLAVITLPAGQDPASFVAGGGVTHDLEKNARDIFSFFIEQATKVYGQKSLSEKMEIGEKIAEVLARLEDPFKQSILIMQASQALRITVEIMQQMIAKSLRKLAKSQQKELQAEELIIDSVDAPSDIEQKIVGALLADYESLQLLAMIDDTVTAFLAEDVRVVVKAIVSHTQMPDRPSFNQFLENFDQKIQDWLIPTSLMYLQPVTQQEFKGLLVTFCRQQWRVTMERLKRDIERAQQSNNYDQMRELLASLSSMRKDIAKKGFV